MGLMVSLLNKIALSNAGTRFYKWSASQKGQDFLVKKLVGFETIAASSLYIASTYHQYKKGNLDKRRHDLLQWQNIGSLIIGYIAGSWLSKKTADYMNNKVIPNLKPELMADAHKVKLGLQVIGPIVCTAILMRGILPACLAWVSGKIEAKRAEAQKQIVAKNKPVNTWNNLDTGKYFNKIT